MSLRHLNIFVTVMRLESITKAAEELHIAQPSVSLAISQLEEHYGQRLFDRIGRRIYPTEAGKELYRYALRMVSLYEDMEKRMGNPDAHGTIRIGASITIGTCLLPHLSNTYKEMYPGQNILCSVARSLDIEAGILANTIDIGLIETQPVYAEIESIPFMKDKMCAIVSHNHPLASHSSTTLKELAQYPFLMREKGSAGRELLDGAYSLLQLPLSIVWESVSTEAIINAVNADIGVAVLPELLIKEAVEHHKVIKLELLTPLERNLYIIHHHSKNISLSMKHFMDICTSTHLSL